MDVINTDAFVHADGLDGKNMKGKHVHFPQLEHEIPELVRQTGIRCIGQAQFEWTLPNGQRYSKPGVCRVQEYVGQNKWFYWDLRTRGACMRCSNRDMQPVFHEKKKQCTYLRVSSNKPRKPQRGIQVQYFMYR